MAYQVPNASAGPQAYQAPTARGPYQPPTAVPHVHLPAAVAASEPVPDDTEPLLSSESGGAKKRKSALECWDDLHKYMWIMGKPRNAFGPFYNCPNCSDFNYNNNQKVYYDGDYVWVHLRFCKACAVGNIRQQLDHFADFPKKVWSLIKGGK